MAEELELISKIKLQHQELEEIERNIKKVEEENAILYEQKMRLDEQVDQKKKELQDKTLALENTGRGRANKEDANDIERREKELDELVRDKLIDLMMSEQDKRKSTAAETLNTNMIISSVLVRYIPDVSDGDVDAMDKADPQEAFFRLNNHTTFRDIKETACEFWKIEEINQIGLRASNFSLLDLYLDQNVQEKILSLRIPPEFWLFKINKLAKTTFTDLKDCFIDSAIASQFKITAPRKRQENKSTGFRKSVHKRIIEKIKGVYRGLDSYEKKPIDLSSDLIERNRIQSPSHNFLASVLIMMIMLFTLLLLGFRREVVEDFWIQEGLNTELISQNGSRSFWDIKDLRDIDEYILDTLGPAMYADDNVTLVIPRRYHPTGKLRIRQLRSKVKPCKHAEDYGLTLVCYESKYLDGKFTKNMTGGKDFNMYHSSTSAPKLIVGEIDNYDSSGFYADFPLDLNLSEFRNQYGNIANTNWLDHSTRAVVINSNLYLPNTNQFIAIFILIEANVLGDSFPSKLQGQTLYSNLYTNSSTDKAMLAIEILRLCLSFFLLYLYILEGLSKDSKGKRSVVNWYNIRNLINLLLFVLIIVALAISFKVNKDSGDILGENYVDLLELAEDYQLCIVMNCWVLLISCFRFTMTFKFINNVSKFHYALDLASKNIIYYMFILLPLLVGMFVLTSHMLGPFDFYYRQLKLVAISNLLFGIGYRDIDYALRLSKAWSIGFILIYYYVIIFFLYSAFIGIIMDSYRISELRHQSVNEAQAKDSEYKPWKLWIFSSFNQCKRPKNDD